MNTQEGLCQHLCICHEGSEYLVLSWDPLHPPPPRILSILKKTTLPLPQTGRNLQTGRKMCHPSLLLSCSFVPYHIPPSVFTLVKKREMGKYKRTMNLYVCITPKILTTFPDADNPQTLALSFFVFNWKLVVDIISEWEWKEPFEILDSKRPFLEMQTTYVNLDPREPLGQPQKGPGTGKRGRFLSDLDQRLHFLTRRTLWV